MRKFRLVALVGVGLSALSAGLAPFGHSASASEAGAFPDYSREEVTRVCLAEYGMENSSVLDCVAQDQTIKDPLSRRWASIDENFRTTCLARLAKSDLKSYSRLDRCVRSAAEQARTPADE